VSIPHVWGMEYTGWLQWGANTNSVMERNIGQALGVGALFDASTYESTVNLDNLHQLESLAYKISPPRWPDGFPPIDTAKAERGRALFYQDCAGCHETFKTDGLMRVYQLFPLSVVGTDPMTAINFERQVMLADGTVRTFPDAALDLITRIKQRAYQERNLDEKTIALWEQRQIRKGPQWDPTFRAPLLNSSKYEDTLGRKVYRAKTLVGIWATAPYLHNGSVPTLYDLLRPAADRPVTFPTGQRDYDPVKLGLQTDTTRFALPPGLKPFLLDTRLRGNWNTGHEWSFYSTLDDDARYALIEFLKTYTEEPANPGTPPKVSSAR
jgi:RoxA-like, cytochrome c-like